MLLRCVNTVLEYNSASVVLCWNKGRLTSLVVDVCVLDLLGRFWRILLSSVIYE